MFQLGLTHRPGFLVNSWELTGPVHIPPAKILEHRQIPFATLNILPVRNPDLTKGTPIGVCHYTGQEIPICIPSHLRARHTHLIGRPGMGKSTLEEHMILDDIRKGVGVAVLDPHGDLVERLLCQIPESHIDRVIYMNPGDPEWAPIWNPLHTFPGQDIGRTADNIVGALKSIVTGWGDRLEHLLRHAIYALMQLPQSSMLDISNLLRNKSKDAEIIRQEILQRVDNEVARSFWLNDFQRYGKDDLGPCQNKLSKLLLSGIVSLMLSQPDSLFNFRQIMDDSMILLVNLSSVGSQIRDTLGSFILSLFHLTALCRADTPPEQRKLFQLYCDEAHRFLTDAVEDLIAETRKYNVGLTLAHQYLSQFGQKKTDALSSVGASIIFGVDARDAQYLLKDLRGEITREDLTNLDIGEAIARIGNEIVKIKTVQAHSNLNKKTMEKIITHSHQKYYKPVKQIQELLREKQRRIEPVISTMNTILKKSQSEGEIEEFVYDEFK